jgi:hypothetical protein
VPFTQSSYIYFISIIFQKSRMAGEGEWPAIGIDLGTTYSCVAVWQHDRVEIIVNDQGNRTTPSYVAFTDKERLVGEAAKIQVARNPANSVFGNLSPSFCLFRPRLFRRKMISVGKWFSGKLIFRKMIFAENIFRCLARTENRKYFFIFSTNHINQKKLFFMHNFKKLI